MPTPTNTTGIDRQQEINPRPASFDQLKQLDPQGGELLSRVATNPWNSGILSRKEVELIALALHAAPTTRDEAGTRLHIRAALDAGASRDEIVTVLQCAVGLSVHSCSLGAPILIEEMKAAGVMPTGGPKPNTPACDAMKAIGQWNAAWDPFFELAPLWTDQFFAFGASIYKSGIFTPRFMELLSIALDASITHMYAPGIRRHIQGALKAGASPEEIMTALEICVSTGLQSCAKGVEILADELNRPVQ